MFNNFHRPTLYLVGLFTLAGLAGLVLGSTEFTLIVIPLALVILVVSLLLGARANRIPDDMPEFTKNRKQSKRGNLEVHDLDQAEKDEEELLLYEEVKHIVDMELEREKAMSGSSWDRFVRRTRVKVGRRFPRFLPANYTLTVPFAGLPEEGTIPQGQFVGGRRIEPGGEGNTASPFGENLLGGHTRTNFDMPDLSHIPADGENYPDGNHDLEDEEDNNIVEWEIDPLPTVKTGEEEKEGENFSDDSTALAPYTAPVTSIKDLLNISLPSFLPENETEDEKPVGKTENTGHANVGTAADEKEEKRNNIFVIEEPAAEEPTAPIVSSGQENFSSWETEPFPTAEPLPTNVSLFDHETGKNIEAVQKVDDSKVENFTVEETETADNTAIAEEETENVESFRWNTFNGKVDLSADAASPFNADVMNYAEEEYGKVENQKSLPPIKPTDSNMEENIPVHDTTQPVMFPVNSPEIAEKHNTQENTVNGEDKIEEGITVEEAWVPETTKPKKKSFGFFRRKNKNTQENTLHNPSAAPVNPERPNRYAPPPTMLPPQQSTAPENDQEWLNDPLGLNGQQQTLFGTHLPGNQPAPPQETQPAPKKHFWNRKKKNQEMVIPYGENKAAVSDDEETPDWLMKIKEGTQGEGQHTLEPEVFNELLVRPGTPADAVKSEDALLRQMRANPDADSMPAAPSFNLDSFNPAEFVNDSSAEKPAETETPPPPAGFFHAEDTPSTVVEETEEFTVSADSQPVTGNENVSNVDNSRTVERLFNRLEETSFVAPFAPAQLPSTPAAAPVNPQVPPQEVTLPSETEDEEDEWAFQAPAFNLPPAVNTGPDTVAETLEEETVAEEEIVEEEPPFTFTSDVTEETAPAAVETETVETETVETGTETVEEPPPFTLTASHMPAAEETVKTEQETTSHAADETVSPAVTSPAEPVTAREEQGAPGTEENPEEDIIVMELDDEYVPKRLATESVPAEKTFPAEQPETEQETVVPDNVNVEEETMKENVTYTSDEEKTPMDEQHQGEHDGQHDTIVAEVEEIFEGSSIADDTASSDADTTSQGTLTAGTDVAVTEVSGEPVLVSDPKVATIANQIAGLLVEAEAEAQNALAKQMEELRAEAEAEKLALEENWQKVVDQIREDALREQKALEAKTAQQIKTEEDRLATERLLMEQEKERLARAHEAELATKIEKKEYERVANQNERLSESLDQAEQNLDHVIAAQRTVADAATMSAKLQAVSRIRKIRQDLADKGTPDDVLDVLDAFVNDFRN